MAEKILRTEYSEEMQKSYLDYSMSVITARAIPDARDGLKPVQRRVLYDMSELRLTPDKPHRKSARIVGDTMGKYHPHGDSSIYETLVVLSQQWKKGMALIDGHGNFGSIEGDGAAAMRYTEAKLARFSQEVYLKDLDKTVNFISNYDETEREPEVLPVRIPNLLLNGAEGIAVGMSTSIPTHNLSEICDACMAYIKNPKITTKELLEILPGPDFPTGGIVANKSELLDIYEKGMGKLKLRGKIEVELGRKKADKDRLVISQIPYTMIGSGINKFLTDVAELVETKKLPEIADISNQSDKNGTRIVLELRKDADIEKIKTILYKKTRLEDSFSVNMLAIVDKRPEVLSLKGILKNYLDFQYQNETKKYQVLLNKERERKEIQEGLIRAVDCIDLIIAILRGSKNLNQAKECLTKGDTTGIAFRTKALEKEARQLNFTPNQAQAILDMRLYRLIGLEIDALLKENKITLKNIAAYERILASRKNMDKVLIQDLEKIKEEFGFPRRTLIEDGKEAVYIEPAVPAEEVIFVMDRFGYCKTLDKAAFEKNPEALESENKYVLTVWNTERIGLFTDKGILHQVKVKDIPHGKPKDKGIPIDNKSKFDGSQEEILLVTSSGRMDNKEVVFLTKKGFIKRVSSGEYQTNVRQVASTRLTKGDALAFMAMTDLPLGEICLVSDQGYVLKFPLAEINAGKKTTKGDKAMELLPEERIAGAILVNSYESLYFGEKKINPQKVRLGHRGGRGSRVK